MKRNDFLAKIKQILIRRRDALRRTLASELALIGRDHELEPVGDPCDEAQESSDDQVFSALAQSESDELRAIENALDRIRSGQYGTCEECDGKIPLARLQALPYASLCINCQRESEKYGRRENRANHWSRVVDHSDDDDRSVANFQLLMQ